MSSSLFTDADGGGGIPPPQRQLPPPTHHRDDDDAPPPTHNDAGSPSSATTTTAAAQALLAYLESSSSSKQELFAFAQRYDHAAAAATINSRAADAAVELPLRVPLTSALLHLPPAAAALLLSQPDLVGAALGPLLAALPLLPVRAHIRLERPPLPLSSPGEVQQAAVLATQHHHDHNSNRLLVSVLGTVCAVAPARRRTAGQRFACASCGAARSVDGRFPVAEQLGECLCGSSSLGVAGSSSAGACWEEDPSGRYDEPEQVVWLSECAGGNGGGGNGSALHCPCCCAAPTCAAGAAPCLWARPFMLWGLWRRGRRQGRRQQGALLAGARPLSLPCF